MAAYYGQVTLLEHEIARLLEALDRLELSQSTLVIFASDHGEMGGGNGLLQKGAVAYDELYRVPLVARWPGRIGAGSTCDQMVNLFDLMPTLLEAGGGAVSCRPRRSQCLAADAGGDAGRLA
jgi:arylsulfatase A-like enzyme